MRILVETSVLVEGSVFWEFGDEKGKILPIKPKKFDRCDMLFKFLKTNMGYEFGVITNTIEDEAKRALSGAVDRVLTKYLLTYGTDILKKFTLMTFQDIVVTESLDRLEKNIVECSVRPSINIRERERIKRDKIKPFFEEIVPNTVRYKQPHIPKSVVREDRIRMEIMEEMLKSLPKHGTVYKSMPGDRDFTIMAEATFLVRKYKERVLVASLDNHFIPNPVQIYSRELSISRYSGEKDATVRDEVEKEFGFCGDDPIKILEEAMKQIQILTH